ncbi:MAG: lysophospholipid acyltransferase family protein [Polyangiaceae bacterium]|nr:lysophospholipid acyltransferase family protein [Polyangiaceae bacterium]
MSNGPPTLRRKIRRFIGQSWLRAFGWKVDGGPPDVKKAVVVAAPHTSNWDFPFTVAVAYAMDLEISWLGKHTLFQGIHGPFFKWMGGIAVDRRSRNNLVDQVVEILNSHDDLLLIVPPEGTRSVTSRWKTGFYYIAVGAKVPVILGFLDFEKKAGGLGHVFWPTGNIESDWEQIREFYRDIKGKHPERMSEIRLQAE